jgi:tryptophan synthase alpha chain
MEMTRLSKRLASLKQNGERALVCYVVAGDPTLDKTVEIVRALDGAGVDAIELGIPFSDPLADGPSIQAAGHRALKRGTTVAGVLDSVSRIREVSEIPIVIMTYYNPALRYGLERFARDAAAAGADGVIQTDLTPEEAGPWITAARAVNLDTVFLLAPTSTPVRVDVVSKLATGFIYCVSRTGVTGARESVPMELEAFVERVKKGIQAHGKDVPVCVGFGVSRPEHIARIGAFADGVVVGSALVDLIAAHAEDPALAQVVRQYVGELKAATR